MPTVESSIEICANQDDVFELSQDYDLRLLWDPFLKEARLLDGATKAAVGARVKCVSRIGLAMETEYTKFAPPDLVAVKMTRGPAILSVFAGSWRFRRIAGGAATKVIFRYHFRAAPSWLGRLLTPAMLLIFRRDTVKRLNALKIYVERSRNADCRTKSINQGSAQPSANRL